jgi:hypothetical protein
MGETSIKSSAAPENKESEMEKTEAGPSRSERGKDKAGSQERDDGSDSDDHDAK